MPTKPLDRLMFAQGERCFFCRQPLPKAEASVEYLVASANDGSNNDENCVACCKAVNAMFGSMSLKEKFQVVLNQKGDFKCPNGIEEPKAKALSVTPATLLVTTKPKVDDFNLIVSNLKQRGNARPRTLKTLRSTIASLFPKRIAESELSVLIEKLLSTGKVQVSGTKVTYAL